MEEKESVPANVLEYANACGRELTPSPGGQGAFVRVQRGHLQALMMMFIIKITGYELTWLFLKNSVIITV